MSTADRKAVIKHADMNEEMQQDAIDCANVALEKFNIEKDIAAYIKKEFDKKYNPTWHCVVGRNFGSYVTHETKHFIYFYMGQVAVLLFKSGWASMVWSHSSPLFIQNFRWIWKRRVIPSILCILWFCLYLSFNQLENLDQASERAQQKLKIFQNLFVPWCHNLFKMIFGNLTR